ncbi:hypothetical protein NG791_00795 [Laspinema sp. D1]|nr:hypothetical protein [Laspinema sp. D2b]
MVGQNSALCPVGSLWWARSPLLAWILLASGVRHPGARFPNSSNLSGKSRHCFSLATAPFHNLTANGLDKIIFVRYFIPFIEINPQ